MGEIDESGRSETSRSLRVFSKLGAIVGFGFAAVGSIGFLISSAVRREWLMMSVAAFVTVLLLGTAAAAWFGGSDDPV